MMFILEKLNESLIGLGLSEDPVLFEDLKAAYSEEGRYYHNVTHVAECLANFTRYRHLADSPCEIELAIWFHDAVYDTHKNDNEEQSARWAERYLSKAKAPSDVIDRVSEMILATKTHRTTSLDSALLLDIDLGILGAPESIFEAYDHAIRREYHWVPEEAYRAGRLQILRSFLKRDRIYQNQVIRDELEQRARSNMERKICELGADLLRK